MKYPFVNIHTHKIEGNNHHKYRIYNFMLHEQVATLPQLYSCGWHPWYIDDVTVDSAEKKLNDCYNKENFIAIGECGLDKVARTDYQKQKSIFEIHIRIALESRLPLIIHCVKAYNDIISFLNKYQFDLPVIFHYYQGNTQETSQLLNRNCYFSFGKVLFENNSKKSIINEIPINRIFFETDDMEEPIEHIYLQAGKLLQIDQEKLKTIVFGNFKKVFKNAVVRTD